jgi:hypothetical protein
VLTTALAAIKSVMAAIFDRKRQEEGISKTRRASIARSRYSMLQPCSTNDIIEKKRLATISAGAIRVTISVDNRALLMPIASTIAFIIERVARERAPSREEQKREISFLKRSQQIRNPEGRLGAVDSV